jgi:hypothetical protein
MGISVNVDHAAAHRGFCYNSFPVEKPSHRAHQGIVSSVRLVERSCESELYAIAFLHHALGIGEGIDVEVIEHRTLVPLDTDTILASVKKTARLITAEDSCVTCAVGAEIVARDHEEGHGLS